MEKDYVDENNEALVICPKCGLEKNVDANKFSKIKIKVAGKCNEVKVSISHLNNESITEKRSNCLVNILFKKKKKKEKQSSGNFR